MAELSPNLQRLTEELPVDQRRDVEEAIASSPYLRQIMTQAVNAGTLEHIRMGVPAANEGGHYDDAKRAIYLSPDTFEIPIFQTRPDKRLDAITSTLGHETGHALDAEQARRNLSYVTNNVALGLRAAEGGVVDMTPMVGAYLHGARQDEAQAEIHGWNALASRLEHIKGHTPSREEMLSRADASTDCVRRDHNDVPRLSPGIILDTDMQMSDTRLPKAGPINLEPVAQCHFDNPRASLGEGGAADYRNYYAAYLIQQIADDTRDQRYPARVELDMAKLGLDKAQLESTGLRLGDGDFYFTDISQGGRRPVVLHGAGSGVQGAPDVEPTQPAIARTAPLLSDVTHPDHGLFLQAREGVHALDRERGRAPDQTSDQLAAALTAEGKAQGMRDIHHVVMNTDGSRAFAVDTPRIDAEWNKVAYVDVAAAVQQPMAESSGKVQQINEMQTLQPQQDTLQRGPEDQGKSGPRL